MRRSNNGGWEAGPPQKSRRQGYDDDLLKEQAELFRLVREESEKNGETAPAVPASLGDASATFAALLGSGPVEINAPPPRDDVYSAGMVEAAAFGSTGVKQLFVPTSLQGKFIGVKGAQINQLRRDSGADIQVKDMGESNQHFIVEIRGRPECVEKGEFFVSSWLNSVSTTKIVEVPSESIGETIGKDGCHLQEIGVKSGCKLSFKDASEFDPSASSKQVCVIVGPASGVKAAEEMLWQRVNEVRELHWNKKSEWQVKAIDVPQYLIGQILGPGGCLLKDMGDVTGTELSFKKASEIYPKGSEEQQLCCITGPTHKLAQAEEMIWKKVAELSNDWYTTDGFEKQTDWQTKTIDIPPHCVGEMIGPQGRNLKEMSVASGCRIAFKRASELDPRLDPEKQICVIQGPEYKMQAAQDMVQQKLNEVFFMTGDSSNSNEPFVVHLVEVAKPLIGEVIGPGGSNIQQLASRSQCKICFKKTTDYNPAADPNDQVCVIQGPADRVAFAEDLVRQKADEVRQIQEKRMRRRREEQGVGAPTKSGSGHNPAQDMRKYKTRICGRWESRQCRLGSKCNFAHGPQELRKLKSEKHWEQEWEEEEADASARAAANSSASGASGSSWGAWGDAEAGMLPGMPGYPGMHGMSAPDPMQLFLAQLAESQLGQMMGQLK